MSEYSLVEKPFLDQLLQLGWTVVGQGQGTIPHTPAASLRQHFRQWLLPDVFAAALRRLNPWLTDPQIEGLRRELTSQSSRSLLEANEAVMKLLFKAQVDRNEATGEADPVVRLIDFENPKRNSFHAINQFRVDTPGAGRQFIVPDIVLFLNGIPLVVVEAKTADANHANPLLEAHRQLLRYRDARPETKAAGLKEGEPRLFHSNLLLIISSGEKAAYGSISSGYEHFHAWRDIWPEKFRKYTPPLGVEREQEVLIQGMLPPPTLLDILRTSTVFMDTEQGRRVKVVCRYQQYRAAHRLVARLRKGKSPAERSGVVWHTQGSGKSLTMVFAARMIRASADLADFKILLVNDRVDLEEQLAKTAKLIGGKVNVIGSTAELRSHLGSGASDLNMVMVHKFMQRVEEMPSVLREAIGAFGKLPEADTFGVVNTSDRILLMIDEAHRTQGSDFGDNLFEAFPNATRVAFTGTPLITEPHGHKRTRKRFGEYIDQYKLLDAVNDGATLKILYEGRTADSALNEKSVFDAKFEDLFRHRSEADLEAIRKKYGASGDILEAEQRIAAIARDLVSHYIDNILPDGFKAQVVCHSKLAALRYQKAIRAALAERLERETDANLRRRIAFLKAAVVVSSDGTNELAEITASRKEAQRMNAVENFCKPFAFDDPDRVNTGIAFLIVCDMLLTGFDAPMEQVMYIDKRLREHNLLQAIARVNRVATGKNRGFIVDYIGLANHLSYALAIYSEADQEDLLAGLKDLSSELPVLEERYQRLLQLFRNAGVAAIEEFLQGRLTDPAAEAAVVNAAVRAMKDVRSRAEFDAFLKRFLESLNLILPHPSGHAYRGAARRFGYLLHAVKHTYKDPGIDFGDAGEKVKALINEHLISLGINPKIPPTELLAPDFLARVRPQADPETKASEMEHAIRRHCTVHFDEDPAFYEKLSEKLDRLIVQHQENWALLAQEYEKLRQEAAAGRVEAHAGMSKEATTFYEYILLLAFGETPPAEGHLPVLQALASGFVETIRSSIRLVQFWKKPAAVKKLRGSLEEELASCGIPEVEPQSERLAVEIMKLAEKRHHELLK